jgi:RNA polymerase sigma factor (sigma-70 family)
LRTVTLPAARTRGPLRSKRLLALAGDERLVDQIRAGNEAAFEVAFERHSPGILSFCRHMLGTLEEAEDAVQQTFTSAYADLLRDQREIRLKPWLYAIARNRCLSVLRARRESPAEPPEVATAGLDEQVQHRAELRELLRDLRDLPEDQRAALLLAELGALSHAEVAAVLDCEVPRVKALVFRARSGLMERREAREIPCGEIREQLANLRGGSLRRSELRHHLRSCPGCAAYREEVKRQRMMFAAVLPVIPSVGLKAGVLSGLGLGAGGSAGGGGAAAGGLGVAAATPAGSLTLAKVAVVGLLAGGGAVAGEAVLDGPDPTRPPAAPAADVATPAGAQGEATAAETPGARRTASARERAKDIAKRRAKRRRGRALGLKRERPARAKARRLARPVRPTRPERPVIERPAPVREQAPVRERTRPERLPLEQRRSEPPAGAPVPEEGLIPPE